jgi:large subunit ribosomal protein L28
MYCGFTATGTKTDMSTLKKNKRIKRAKLVALYGDTTPVTGNSVQQRGKYKYLGGNGRQTTGISKRLFRRNIKRIRVIEDGRVVRRNVPVKMIRSGMIQKPQIVDPFAVPEG